SGRKPRPVRLTLGVRRRPERDRTSAPSTSTVLRPHRLRPVNTRSHAPAADHAEHSPTPPLTTGTLFADTWLRRDPVYLAAGHQQGAVQPTLSPPNVLRSFRVSSESGNGMRGSVLRSVLTTPGTIRAARAHCQPQCFGEHASQRLLRGIGVREDPAWYAGFYRRALHRSELPTSRPIRALICGATDESILAMLAGLLGPDRLDAYQVDSCGTPLYLTAAFADRCGIAFACEQLSSVTSVSEGPYDLVAMDGLPRIPHWSDRAALVSRLAAVLAPGGLVLSTVQIPASGEEERLVRLVEAAVVRAAWPGSRQVRHDLAQAVLVRPQLPNPFPDGAAVRQAFSDAFSDIRLYARRRSLSPAGPVGTAGFRAQGGVLVGIVARSSRSSS
ncbi:MAG: hypothetical protein JWO67_6293, partial [Streptosporangiaceae bacterium]|nr:hypothetical protein [Streptosporangiaceae bacterium]